MKRSLFLPVLLFFSVAISLHASKNFEAPLPANGKSLSPENRGTVSILYEQVSMDEIRGFYTEEFNNKTDRKWVEGKNQRSLVIHDWGNREWHKISVIDKGQGKGVLVTVQKDSWTWILGTLVIRFVGVFIVLIVLMIALYISGSILSTGKPTLEKGKP